MQELKPILTKFSQKEYEALMEKAAEALERGDEVEHDRLLSIAPISPEQAFELKRYLGIKGMIAEKINLSWAVEAFGEDWLQE